MLIEQNKERVKVDSMLVEIKPKKTTEGTMATVINNTATNAPSTSAKLSRPPRIDWDMGVAKLAMDTAVKVLVDGGNMAGVVEAAKVHSYDYSSSSV